ncbi:MAG: hypothetical protein AAGD14_10375 [Planctomycetota bacterium]
MRLLPILLLASPIFADEVSDWSKTCMQRLNSADERVRRSAGSALSALGLDVIPVVVQQSASLNDKGWVELKRSLRAMGAVRAAAALESRSESWPAAVRGKLAQLALELKATAIVIDVEVDKQVHELLEKFRKADSYMSDDPNVLKIRRLGRPAAPSLIRAIDEYEEAFPTMWMTAATDALKPLVLEADRPALRKILLDGKTDIARCFARIPGDESRDVLLEAIGEGIVGHELLEELRRYANAKPVRRALIGYLERSGSASEWSTAAVADFLGEIRAYDAIPVLERLAAEAGGRFEPGLAQGLVRLGSRKGVPLLIAYVANRRNDAWERHSAAEVLNEVTRRGTYVGGNMWGASADSDRLDKAAEAFRKFWDEKKDKLSFDRKVGAWKER